METVKNKPTLQQQVQEMSNRVQSLLDRGYTLINEPADITSILGSTPDSLPAQEKQVMEHYGLTGECSCCDHTPSIMSGIASYQIDGEECLTQKMVGTDGKPIGTNKLGYIQWGTDDRLPMHIFRAAGLQIYTARAKEFLSDTLQGLGPKLMYKTIVINNGKPEEIKMPFEWAGVWIADRLSSLRAAKEQQAGDVNGADKEQPKEVQIDDHTLYINTFTPDGAPSAATLPIEGEGRGEGLLQYRTAAPPPPPPPSSEVDMSQIGTIDWQIANYEQDYRTWLDTVKELETFNEQTNLTDLWARCSVDDITTDQYCMVTHFDNIGRGASWKPKIMCIEHRPIVCCRMEKRDERMRSNYVYYSDNLFYRNTMALAPHNCMAYPALRQQRLLADLKEYVAAHQKGGVANRKLDHAIFMQEYCGYTSYYQVPAWWSIFTSLVYQYVSTFMIDKTIERANANMASHLIFISDNYMAAYYAEMGATEREDKLKLRGELVNSIDRFLKDKNNNGKCLTLSKFIAPDGKTEIKNIEIVAVPKPASTTTKEDMEECANLIFWAMGVHSQLIGSFGKQPTTGGTSQRELTLLKQCALSPRQQKFVHALESIFKFNGWDKHLCVEIGREVLTTLDASKTGIKAQ